MVIIFSLAACGSQSDTIQSSQSIGAETSSSKSSTQTSSSIDSSTEENSVPDDRGIPGADYFTVIYVLYEEFGIYMGTKDPSSIQELSASSVSSFYTDEEQGAKFDYSISLDRDDEIISATFGVTNLYTNEEAFLNRAKLYIYGVGLMPYNTADSEATAKALYDAVDSLEDGKPFVVTKGDAEFSLNGTRDSYGGLSSVFVQISKIN